MLISFSLWGDNPLYLTGILENLKLAPKVYPGSSVRVYHDSTVPYSSLVQMIELGADTVRMERTGAWSGLFWRFLPASDSSVDTFIVRDADSRLNTREAAAVKEWLDSDKDFHCMRDNWQHTVPIMGGMWGCRKGVVANMDTLINKWNDKAAKGTDQDFLQWAVWPLVRGRSLTHDRYYDQRADRFVPTGSAIDVINRDPQTAFGSHHTRPFPPHAPMEHGSYVGQASQDF